MLSPDLPLDDAAIDPATVPGLIVPVNTSPTLDLSDPGDCPDRPDGEWSAQHFAQYLARQPRSMVFIQKPVWAPKGEDTYEMIGIQGHRFRVLQGKPVSVPIQIAAIIEQSQAEFPTQQSQLRKRQITDIRDLPDVPASRGVPGTEVFLPR
jgi:hypothetical protein